MALDDILAQVPIDDIAAKLGVSPGEAKKAVEEGGAVLLTGLAKNAESAEGSAAIQKALRKHEGATPTKVDEIDEADGDRIVRHVLGDKKAEVTTKLTESKETAGIDFGKLLPILAPIVMNLIANASKGKAEKAGASGEGSGGIGDLIGGILGGGSQAGTGGGIDLGGILGSLFGGRK
ncbi:DUF937 domain-containing protein [Microbacterium sp. M28]|uniref:DUF937 domain-containing protein n=1 Tax=Microbacterium sp. M28 TaxID=2962064 RepID=UPI0021F49BE3|nr:DUF937 domain-containing protein [Microbacterium sp. M28]UYO96629.1 DUF937 domain-containing protein [Microbacterium sp. M28]